MQKFKSRILNHFNLNSNSRNLFIIILLFVPYLSYSTTWYVATSGNDTNSGSFNSPFKTLKKAISNAFNNDIIELRGGTYPSDEIKIELDNLTIRSYAGEWAIIKAPIDKGEDIASCLWYSNEKTRGGTLERLEIIGGAFYGVKFESNWNWGLPDNERSGASGIKIIQCKIHDTGRDCIKITPGCNDISIISCEIYNSGVDPENSGQNGGPNAEGIDNVNGSRMIVQNCYFHDISTNGLYAKGGAVGCIIEGNLLVKMGEAGIGVGFYTDGEWFDAKTNPNYYESINTIVKNNIIINIQQGGIVVVGAKGCKIHNNTVITSTPVYHAPLTFLSGEVGIDENITFHPVSTDLEILNNIFVDQSPSGEEDYTILMRENSLEGNNIIDYNIFYKSNGGAIKFDDGDWPSKSFADWKGRGFDSHGLEINPNLNAELHLNSGSPAIDKGKNISSVTFDYDGLKRTGTIDIGADEFGNGEAISVPPHVPTIGTGAIGITTSTQNNTQPLFITSLYPNPTNDVLNIKLDCTTCNFELYTIIGDKIAMSESPIFTTSGLPSGVYFLKIYDKNSSAVVMQRVVISHP